MKKIIPMLLAASLILSAAGCGNTSASANETTAPAPAVTESAVPAQSAPEPESAAQLQPVADAAEPGSTNGAVFAPIPGNSEMFSDRELDPSYDAFETITLSDGGSTSDSSAVSVSGDTVTITHEGVYEVSGSLTNGSIIVDAGENDKVQLVLSGADIHSDTFAAIYVKQADKVFLTLSEGSENSLSSGDSFTPVDENNVDAAVYSRDDLALCGSGSLTVSAPAGHGIVSKDDLVICGGTYSITAASCGISANDSIRMAAGDLTVTSGTDAIRAKNTEDEAEGFVYIENGTLNLTSTGDAVSASSSLTILDGSFAITAGNGSHGEVTPDENGGTVSAKGLKASGEIQISGGSFAMDCLDDGVHSGSNILMSGGSFTLASGDDGFHADAALTISGGTIDITESNEGLEGLNILINGGDISIVSSDDGINAAGGADNSGFGHGFAMAASTTEETFSEGTPSLEITGGNLVIDSEGDSLDSNVSFHVSGGTIVIYGPTSSGNGMLDYNGEGVITGGTVVAFGPSGMSPNFSTSSTQGSILVLTGNQEASTECTLTDANGNVLLSGTAKKGYDAVIVSTPELSVNNSYTVTAGTSTETISLTSLIYGSGGNMGGGRGMRG